MLTCIAIDDEPLALEVLKKYIAKIYFLDLKGAFTDPFEAQKLMETSPVDILFLDIQMPDINGIEFSVSSTRKIQPLFLPPPSANMPWKVST